MYAKSKYHFTHYIIFYAYLLIISRLPGSSSLIKERMAISIFWFLFIFCSAIIYS